MSVVESEDRGLFQRMIGHSGLKKYFINTSWLLAENILRLLAGFFIGVYVARYLGPQQFGVFSYSVSFVALFSAIAKLGLDSIIVRELVNKPEERDKLLGTAFWLKIVGALSMLTIIWSILPYAHITSYANQYILIIATGTIFQAFEVVSFYFQSRVQAKYISICKTGQLFLLCVCQLYAIYAKAGLIVFVFLMLLSQVSLGVFLAIAFCYKVSFQFLLKFDSDKAKALLLNSWPLILSGLVTMIYMRIDQIMINSFLGDEQVGIYSAAVKLSECWYFIPTLITSSVFPAILSAKNSNKELYYLRLQRLFSYLVWVGIIIAFFLTLFSDLIIISLYGFAYKQAGNVLLIHAWAGIFVCLGVSSGSWFIAENLVMLSFWRTFYGMVVNVVFNLVLIPRYGIQGAAVATLVSYCVASFLFDAFCKDTRRLFFMKLRSFDPRRLL